MEPGCTSQATENLGKRDGRGKGGLTLLCEDCADMRLGRPKKSPQITEQISQPIPTRSASFAEGHQKESWWQPELGQ